ncbi:hypothetical protein NQZ68_010339 [Dissostichus eleginoides]|nr:hypothetical protein NQZ68_010339 [Dissostichus eleginoides]
MERLEASWQSCQERENVPEENQGGRHTPQRFVYNCCTGVRETGERDLFVLGRGIWLSFLPHQPTELQSRGSSMKPRVGVSVWIVAWDLSSSARGVPVHLGLWSSLLAE